MVGPGAGLARRATRLVLDRGLVSGADVHRYGITGRDLSESNGVALVELGNGRGLAAKDLAAPRDGGQGDPEREIALYGLAATLPGAEGLLPALIAHAEDEQLLVLEGVMASRRLDRASAGVLDEPTAAAFGQTLGSWHRAAAPVADQLTGADPWVLRLDRSDRLGVLDTDERLADVANRVVGDPTLVGLLAAARRDWAQACTDPARRTVVHGDVRFANVLVRASPPAAILVDWEMAGTGSGDWDVAAALGEYASVGAEVPGLDGDVGGPAALFVDAYAQAAGRRPAWPDLAASLGCRFIQRAIQLTSWLPPDEASAQVTHQLALAARCADAAGRHQGRAGDC